MLQRSLSIALLIALVLWLPVSADSPAYHTVAWGETLYSIARLFNTTPEALARLNG
ncbi:MAG TPA: LysM domain-containing protein, partial [Anaerolineae bacterium]